MLLATVASLVTLVVVVAAIVVEQSQIDRRASALSPGIRRAAPKEPGSFSADGGPVNALARPTFPRVRDGYEPEAVDAYLDRLEALVAQQLARGNQLPAEDVEALRTEAALGAVLHRSTAAREDETGHPYPSSVDTAAGEGST